MQKNERRRRYMYCLNRLIPAIRPVHSYSGLTVGKRGYCIRHILLPCYLFLLFAGALFFIPAIFVNRFTTAPELFFIRLSLLATGICALFSYPFNYPFVRLMAVALLSFMSVTGSEKGITLRNGYLFKTTAILFASGLLSASARQAFYERQWHIVAHKSLRGENVRMLPRYESLYAHLHHNDLFLYNYAAELNVAGQYAESIRIAGECGRLWADYDLHMLMADNRLQLQQHDETENQLKQAAAMCPVKFMPLYKLAELYVETGRKEEARGLAKKIMNKKVKIASPVINGIKNKMRKLLNETDSLNDLSQVNK